MRDKITSYLWHLGMDRHYKVVDGLAKFDPVSRFYFYLIDLIDPNFSDGG